MSDLEVLGRVEYGANSVPAFNIGDAVVDGSVYKAGISPLVLIPKPKRGTSFAHQTFSVELAGSGVVATPPRDADLFMAMGLDETIAAGVSATYAVTGLLADLVTGLVPVDIDLFKGNAFKCACNDAVGTFNMTIRPGEAVEMAYAFDGRYEAPTEAAGAAAAATSADPVVAAGLTATVNTKTLIYKEISIALNATNNSPNLDVASANAVAAPKVVNQAPTFSFTAQRPPFSDLNFHALALTNTKISLIVVLGATPGNICTITVDGYMNAVPQESFINGTDMVTISCDMSWIAADTQLQLVYT